MVCNYYSAREIKEADVIQKATAALPKDNNNIIITGRLELPFKTTSKVCHAHDGHFCQI
jgi:hypothetical protein